MSILADACVSVNKLLTFTTDTSVFCCLTNDGGIFQSEIFRNIQNIRNIPHIADLEGGIQSQDHPPVLRFDVRTMMVVFQLDKAKKYCFGFGVAPLAPIPLYPIG